MGSCRRFGIHPEVRSGDIPSQFDQPLRGWLPRFDIPRGIIWMGTWRTLHPRRILHAPGAISVHDGFSPGELINLRTLPTWQPGPISLQVNAGFYADV